MPVFKAQIRAAKSALGDKRTFCVARVMSRLPHESGHSFARVACRSGGDGNKFIIAFDGGWLCQLGVSANRARNCATLSDMLKRETFPVANIYVPTARRKTLDVKRVDAIAHSMLTEGQQTPILVRADGARFVLVEGLHRLEAAKALGEATIVGYRVEARKH